jgi:hypothetical protein
MRCILFIVLIMLKLSVYSQDKDASHYFEYHPEGTTLTVFETETFHGTKTVDIKGKSYHYTTEDGDWGVDTNYYWDDDEYFYKYYPGLDISDNFLPKKVHLNLEWAGTTGKHKYHVAKTLDKMEINGAGGELIEYDDVIHVIMSPVQKGLYVPYHYYYAKGVGVIKLLHETNSYELKIERNSLNSQ